MPKSALSPADTTYGCALRQPDANCNSHANAHCHCHRDSYSYAYRHSNTYSPTHANAKI
jgi:hypothetical protein